MAEVLLRHVHRRTSVRRRRHHPPLGPSVLVCRRLSNFPWLPKTSSFPPCAPEQTEAVVKSMRFIHEKTSLLFQFAINRAAESGRQVVFICSKGRLENSPPFLSQGVEPSLSVLQRIQIKYIEDDEGIRKYFAAFHLLDNFPAAVIVDDFTGFFSERSCQLRYGNFRARDLALVRILALCQNAISHANAKLGTIGSCNLLLSDVHQGDNPRSLFIYKRWIGSIYTIQGDGFGSYVLKNISTKQTGTKEARAAKYSIALQYLVLEEIKE